MNYTRNNNFEYISNNDDSLIIYNSNGEEIFILNDIATKIIQSLKNPKTLDELLNEILTIYEGSEIQIKNDIEAFLNIAISNEIIIILD